MLRPDYEGAEYEVYVVEPVLLGTIRINGAKKLQVNGNSRVNFSNLESAIYHMNKKVFEKLGMKLPVKTSKYRRVSGAKLHQHSNWKLFCEKRNLNESVFINTPSKHYDLSSAEAEMIELNLDENSEVPVPPSKTPQLLRHQK